MVLKGNDKKEGFQRNWFGVIRITGGKVIAMAGKVGWVEQEIEKPKFHAQAFLSCKIDGWKIPKAELLDNNENGIEVSLEERHGEHFKKLK
uniref:Uncharacterized protein n=1 Tax=Tanacetum cinerariifolium TaxID=118510 RepID=A0A6L2LWR1_TANCI|nr:hypothetical protein [Tanacetum cinerariifolium]